MGMEVRIMNTTVTEASTHTSPDGNTAGSGNANNGNGNFGHNGNGKLVFTIFLSPWDIEVTGRREYMILSSITSSNRQSDKLFVSDDSAVLVAFKG